MKNWKDSFRFQSGVKIDNRIILAPLTTSSGTTEGGLSSNDIPFLLHRSKGFGAIILGSHSISSNGSAFSGGWNIYNKCNHEPLAKIVKQFHNQGVKVFIQIYHAGRLAQPSFIGGQQPVAPSRVPAIRKFASYPKELTISEINEIIEDFRQATKTAILLGFDGVELHGANTYLIQQFYSPHSNRRTDEWGGERDKRLKFPLKVIEACHEEIKRTSKKPFVLGYRFSPEEYETPGIRLEDTCYFLNQITRKSILDYLHISINDFRKKSIEGKGIIETVIASLNTNIPLIGCGRIHTIKDVQNVMKIVPLFSVANAAIIDPNWAVKIINDGEGLRDRIKLNEQSTLKIPQNLWEMLLQSPSEYFLSERDKEMQSPKNSIPLPLRE